MSAIAGCVVTLPCQSYKTIGVCCNDDRALSLRFRSLFGANPMRDQWLQRVVHRSDPSGTTIAYWKDDPNRAPRRVRLTDGSPDHHELIFPSSSSRHDPI